MNDSIHGGLRVCQSTPLVQLQDRGRFGCRHLGVTQGGALDWLSMGWANWLLGNPLDAAVIEIALGGFVAECRADGWLALAGGDLGATLDGQPLPAWGAFAVRDGQRLAFAHPRQGARAYLAAPGGFAGERQLG
ncbi:TPA: allophanate hydrolase, partial [Pseudomonas aeruginosa]|nr:allophanate hydrolase [Pseudomonas aeruginosa]HCE6961261.1 allophanate hydrolase [Pseudomonas aeruginosa]HCE8057338.1 allophanate hydrolase [Pseudomonas aeruginosa]